jgi:hypothetical protein
MAALAFVVLTVSASEARAPDTQRITRLDAPRVYRLTPDSLYATVRCTASSADTVRSVWTYAGTTARTRALRPAACVDSIGVYRGTVAQTLSNTATAKRGAVVGSARTVSITVPPRVVVLPPPNIDSLVIDTISAPPYVPPVATSFSITPDVVTLRNGATQQFNTQTAWTGSAPAPATITWSATGGTITGAGLYTAGATGGTYRVIAWCSCFTRPDTAVITVTTGTVTPPPDTTPPAVPSAFAPNLPAGMQLIAESSFENYVNGSRDADGIEIINWTGNTAENAASFGVRSSTTNGGYGTKSIRAFFPGNHAGDGVGPLTMMVSGLNSRAHYMVTRMRYSPNYVFHTNSEKLFYPVQNVAGEGNWGAASLNVSGFGHLVGVSGPIQTAPVGEPKTAPNVVPIGPWFTAEFFVELNTPGQANGTWQAWINGVRVMNVTNWRFSNNPTTQMLFTLARQDMTRGGGPSTILTPPEGVWVEVDRLAFYKR